MSLQQCSRIIAVLVFAATALTHPNHESPVVTVRNGSYTGLRLPGYEQDVFLGVPYAQSTAGENRFRIPQSLNTSWTGSRKAKTYGPACPDVDPDDALYGMSEDCLSLNVVRPAASGAEYGRDDGAGKLPVMVWIHGGSYQVGTSGLAKYNLTFLVERSVQLGKPVVGVSINYRKGGWGNMYSIEMQGSGNTNLALRDMRKALAWIRENISSFGGDKDNVTIWGQSAGSFAVGQLLMSYGGQTDNLFHRSIQESGSAATAWCNGSDWYQPIYNRIVDRTNCSEAPDTLACLRTVPYATLYPLLNSSDLAGPGWYPTVDGDIYPDFPTQLLEQGRFARIPHLYGCNSDEGTDNAPLGAIDTDADLREYLLHGAGFGYPASTVDRIMELYPDDPSQGVPIHTGSQRFEDHGVGKQWKRVAAVVGDIFYHATRRSDAREYAKYSPTYTYRFNTRPFDPETGGLAPAYKGVEHSSEVAFVFGNPERVGPWPEYQRLAEQVSAQWILFANDGDPNGGGLPEWPVYNVSDTGRNLVIQREQQGGSHVEEDTYRLEPREYLSRWARRRHV